MLTSSSYTIGAAQADGRHLVVELHTGDDGQTYNYEWLSDGSKDPQMVMEERAAVINATLAAREAARLMVAGTSVPLTRFQFLDRFTTAERVAIRAASATDTVVEDFMEMMKLSGNVSLSLARPGLAYLVSIGKLTQARADVIGSD